MSNPAELYEAIQDEVSNVFLGHEEVIEGLTIAMLTNGHVLLEGVPGIAKTTAAKSFAQVSGLNHARIQMTSDILPTDITGTTVFRQKQETFEIRKGPIFANLVLVDEINRATPKAQSALLEAMEEETVTIEDETLELPSPFLVIATQNPIERDGTFPLPAAQRDRFQMKLTMEIPERQVELDVMERFDERESLDADTLTPVTLVKEIQDARETVKSVHVTPEINQYILDITAATREHAGIEHGVSTRGALALRQTAKGLAAINTRHYVIPDDIKQLAEPTLEHRLVLTADTEISGTEPRVIIEEIVESVEAPTGLDKEGQGDPSSAAISDGGAEES